MTHTCVARRFQSGQQKIPHFKTGRHRLSSSRLCQVVSFRTEPDSSQTMDIEQPLPQHALTTFDKAPPSAGSTQNTGHGTPVLLYPTSGRKQPRKKTVTFVEVMKELNGLAVEAEEEDINNSSSSDAIVPATESGADRSTDTTIGITSFVSPDRRKSVVTVNTGPPCGSFEYDDYVDMAQGRRHSVTYRPLTGAETTVRDVRRYTSNGRTDYRHQPVFQSTRAVRTRFAQRRDNQWPVRTDTPNADRVHWICNGRDTASTPPSVFRRSYEDARRCTFTGGVVSPAEFDRRHPMTMCADRSGHGSFRRRYDSIRVSETCGHTADRTTTTTRGNGPVCCGSDGGDRFDCDYEDMSGTSSCWDDINQKMELLMGSVDAQEKRIETIHRMFVEKEDSKRRCSASRSAANTYCSLAEDVYQEKTPTVEKLFGVEKEDPVPKPGVRKVKRKPHSCSLF